MNKRIKRLWVAALRSGEYKQGHGQLRRRKDTFCCLGVLCNIHAQEHPDIAAKQKNQNVYMGEDGLLPDAVMRWAGLRQDNPELLNEKEQLVCLAELNDNGVKFSKIADLIEKRL